MEVLELIELLADRHQLDGASGDGAHGQGRTAARIAVELREDHAIEGDALLEGERNRDRLLTRHRVEHEQDVRRLRLCGDPLELGHQVFIDVEPTGRVQDHDVEALLARGFEA